MYIDSSVQWPRSSRGALRILKESTSTYYIHNDEVYSSIIISLIVAIIWQKQITNLNYAEVAVSPTPIPTDYSTGRQ